MAILSFLSQIDMYSYKFHLNFFKQKRISTLYGQIASIVTIILGLFFIIFFFEDFFNRKGPNTNISKLNDLKYQKTQLKNRNFIIAFRLINSEGISIDFYQKIFPALYYLTIKKNDSGIIEEIKLENMNFIKCNMYNLHKKDIDINNFNIQEFYCFNFSDFDFESSENFETKYLFQLNLCPNKLNYNPNDSNIINLCSEEKFIKDLSNYKIEILYPEIYIQPYNISKYIITKLKNIKYSLSYNLLSYNYFFIQENEINDDKGWLSRKYNKNKFLSIEKIEKDYVLRNSDILIEGGNSTFFTLYLIYSKDYIIYTRYYIKIPQILTNIVIFIRIIMIIFNQILEHFQTKIENLEIFYNIFDCSQMNKNGINISSNFNNSNSSNGYLNFIPIKNNTLKPFTKSNIFPKNNINNNCYTPKNNNFNSRTKSKFFTVLNNQNKTKNIENSNISSQVNFNEIPMNLKKKKMNLTIVSLWLKGKQSKEYRRDYLFYEKVKNYILNMKDFNSLIKIGVDIGIIRFFFNEIDSKIFPIKKKINPSIKEDMKLIIEFKERDNLLFEKI